MHVCSMFQWICESVYIPQSVLVALCMYFVISFICFCRPVTSLPKLYFAETEFNNDIVRRAPGLKSAFRPPVWLCNRHVQTFLGNKLYQNELKLRRKYIELRDNGLASIDLVLNNYGSLADDSTILLLLPGLVGSRNCSTGVCRLALKKNYRVVIFNKRGYQESHLATPVLQTFGDARDFRQCVEYLHLRYPQAKMAAVGYSAGSGLLQSYLGSYTGQSFMSAAVCISSGYNVAHLSMTNISRIYERLMVRWLKCNVVKPNEHVLKSSVDLKAVYRSTSFSQFDYHLYCKMHGYRDVAQMWTDINPMRDVHRIDIPVLCINSIDDPLCLGDNIPYDLFKKHNLMLVTTEKGGHCGFLENLCTQSWADTVTLEYFEAVMEIQHSVENKE